MSRKPTAQRLRDLTQAVNAEAEKQEMSEEQLIAELRASRRALFDQIYGPSTTPHPDDESDEPQD